MQKGARLAFSVTMLLIGAGLLVYSYVWGADMSVGERFGPMFYPRFILWAWVLLAMGLTVETLFAHSVQSQPVNKKALLASIASVAVCCALLPYLGFLVTCVLFCCAYPLLLGYRKIAVVIISAVLFSVATWYVFNSILLIALPEGLIG